jgi:hypothetical protein
MSAYAVVNTLALVLLSAGGYPVAAAVLAAVLTVWTTTLEVLYWFRRRGDRLPAHRGRLDTLVRVQVLACVACAVVVVAAGFRLGFDARTRTYVEFLDGALLVAALSVWLSALIDWYWILPRLAGIGGPPPCHDTHAESWNSITKVWLYHRALATLLFIGGLAAIPAYLAVATKNHAFAVVMGVVTFGVPAVFSDQASAAVKALMNGLNPAAPVGSIVRVRLLESVVDVYLVDASLQGSKYKRLDRSAGWDEKSDGPAIPNATLAAPNLSEVNREALGPCLSGCHRYNWYCRENEKAYSRRG